MNNVPITTEVEVNAPVCKVWEALTNNNKMKEWYFDLEAFEATPGFEFRFVGGTDEHKYLHICEVKEVEAEKKLSHTWTYENVPVETTVTWELTSHGEHKTLVSLTHSGVENFPADNKDFARENFVAGWNEIVKTSLKNYVERD